ncbi:UrcA family protein [Sphingomonas sp. QA11]|uniref:UrcA family protein n=1 Tax=Sphingomonas sp. QA11 TaxID=2950605 RepID=UPI0023497CC6|nr:UrcA family protein [Sphingomonas sp. QA11]WCM26568.1 UrcA family protein [Sphingomonas sp. QA11]
MLKLLIPAALLGAALPNAAQAMENPADVHVAYRDLNLKSPSGVRMLDRRIERAVSRICVEDGALDMQRRLAVFHCRRVALAKIASQRAAALENAARGNVELAASADR